MCNFFTFLTNKRENKKAVEQQRLFEMALGKNQIKGMAATTTV